MLLVQSLKVYIKQVPWLYRSVVSFIGFWGRLRTKRSYRKHGKEALRLFVNCMETNNVHYTLAFGSILGAIREHGFIKHDLDIDIFVWYRDFSSSLIPMLEKVGFSLCRSISIDSDKYGREDTVQYKGVHIDVFYLYPAIDKYPYCCDFLPVDGNRRLPRRVEIPVSYNRKRAVFEGINVYIPENAEQVCEFRYGPDYMTPDPNWHWRSSYNAVKEWPEMIEKTVVVCF